jgi:tRNA G18 (ribose-2'-O)-methylase SpoU
MLARAVRDGRNTDYIFVEGLRLCEEALRSALEIEAVVVSEELLQKERVAESDRRVRPGGPPQRCGERETSRVNLLHEDAAGDRRACTPA